MFVCICKGVKSSQIRQSVEAGAQHFRDVRDDLQVGTQCGKCVKECRRIIDQTLSEQEESLFREAC